MIFLLLTGLRFGKTRKLKWSHVDFENKLLIVPRELTNSDREHRLPLSDFLAELLKKRYLHRKYSEWGFQSSRLKDKHLGGGVGIVRRVRAKSGILFTFHDLRRTFLTMGVSSDANLISMCVKGATDMLPTVRANHAYCQMHAEKTQ